MLHKSLSARHVLAFALGFWLTAITFRIIIFWAFLYGRTPAVYLYSHHIHHFIFGLGLLVITGALYYYLTLPGRFLLLLSGIGAGLMFDEFLYWTRGLFDYWNIYNFFALSFGAVICLAIYSYAKRQELDSALTLPGERQNHSRMVAVFSLYLAFLYSLFAMQHTMVAQAKQDRSVKKQIKNLSVKVKNELLETIR